MVRSGFVNKYGNGKYMRGSCAAIGRPAGGIWLALRQEICLTGIQKDISKRIAALTMQRSFWILAKIKPLFLMTDIIMAAGEPLSEKNRDHQI